jgi:hypothetical protein
MIITEYKVKQRSVKSMINHINQLEFAHATFSTMIENDIKTLLKCHENHKYTEDYPKGLHYYILNCETCKLEVTINIG